MSDETMDDLVAGLDSGQTPNDPSSQQSQGGSPGDSDVNLDALIERLAKNPKLVEVFENTFRSEKDKGIARASKEAKKAMDEVSDMRATVAKFQDYLKKFGDEERAFFEMERDEKIETILGKPTQGAQIPGKDERPWGLRQKEILESAGLSLSDERVREFAVAMRDAGADPERYLTELATKTFEWAQADVDKPNPTPGTVANPTKGVPTGYSKDDPEALGAELIALSKDATKNAKRIGEIDARLRELDKGA